MIALPGPSVGSRGFSLRELGLTLFLVAVIVAVAVRIIDLRTKLLVVEKDDPGLARVLEVAARAVSRDATGAGRGGLPPWDALRPVADNTPADGAGYPDVAGVLAVVRAGTDQLGLRGVIRTPLLALRLSAAPGMGTAGWGIPDRIPADTSSVRVLASALAGVERDSHTNDPREVAERLGAATRRAKRFFLVADREGRSAVAVVRGWSSSRDAANALDLRLDFTDREAAALNPRRERDAAGALGTPVAGGLLDDIVWFVARGATGRYPDYDAVNDPPSMKFPHPFLAVAEFAGNGRWEIARVGEDVEEFQVAWGLAAAGEEPTWRGAAAGSPAPAPSDLADAAGRSRLGSLRFAWTAKAERRFGRGDGPRPPLDFPPLLNAPAPGSMPDAGPVGWDRDESRRIPFERASKEFVLNVGGAAARTPRGTPPRVK